MAGLIKTSMIATTIAAQASKLNTLVMLKVLIAVRSICGFRFMRPIASSRASRLKTPPIANQTVIKGPSVPMPISARFLVDDVACQ